MRKRLKKKLLKCKDCESELEYFAYNLNGKTKYKCFYCHKSLEIK